MNNHELTLKEFLTAYPKFTIIDEAYGEGFLIEDPTRIKAQAQIHINHQGPYLIMAFKSYEDFYQEVLFNAISLNLEDETEGDDWIYNSNPCIIESLLYALPQFSNYPQQYSLNQVHQNIILEILLEKLDKYLKNNPDPELEVTYEIYYQDLIHYKQTRNPECLHTVDTIKYMAIDPIEKILISNELIQALIQLDPKQDWNQYLYNDSQLPSKKYSFFDHLYTYIERGETEIQVFVDTDTKTLHNYVLRGNAKPEDYAKSITIKGITFYIHLG